MPNSLTSLLTATPTNTSADARPTEQPEAQDGSGFLDILNLVAAKEQPIPEKPEIVETEVVQIEVAEVETLLELPDADSDLPSVATLPRPDTEPVRAAAPPEVAVRQPDPGSTAINDGSTVRVTMNEAANMVSGALFDKLNRGVTPRETTLGAPQAPRANSVEIAPQAAILRGGGDTPKQDRVTPDNPEISEPVPATANAQTRALASVTSVSALANGASQSLQMLASDLTKDRDEVMFDSKIDAAGATRDGPLISGTRDSAASHGPAPARPEMARAIAGQMATVITAKPGSGGVEIALNPEELGRVSITMGGREDGLHLIIAAERPETLDLMRRHIGVLSAEFQKLGLGDLSFDLGLAGESRQDAKASPQQASFDPLDLDDAAETAPQPIPTGPERGLDLRL